MLVVDREVSTFTPDNDQPPTNNAFLNEISFPHTFLSIQMDRKKELKDLEESKTFFQEQIAAERKFSEELKNNPAAIEKFAREQYKMKRDGEDLFLIQP